MIFEFVSQQISIFAFVVVSTLLLCATMISRISMFAYVGDTSIYDSKTSSRHFPLMMMLSVKRSQWTICMLTKILVIKYWKFSFSTLLGTSLFSAAFTPFICLEMKYFIERMLFMCSFTTLIRAQSNFFLMRTNSSSSGTQTHGKKGELQDCFFRISRVSPLESAPSSQLGFRLSAFSFCSVWCVYVNSTNLKQRKIFFHICQRERKVVLSFFSGCSAQHNTRRLHFFPSTVYSQEISSFPNELIRLFSGALPNRSRLRTLPEKQEKKCEEECCCCALEKTEIISRYEKIVCVLWSLQRVEGELEQATELRFIQNKKYFVCCVKVYKRESDFIENNMQCIV